MGTFDDDGFGIGVYFRYTVWSVDDPSELMSRVLVLFPFDSEVCLVSRFALFGVISNMFINVALVGLLSCFKSCFCVSDGFWRPLIPSVLKLYGIEKLGCGM